MYMIKNTDFSYAAGYIDGDGCFHLGQYKKNSLSKFRNCLIISSTCKEVLNWFKDTFSGSITCKTNIPDGQKPQLHFNFLRGKSINFITEIFPYLVEKRDECKIFFQFREEKDRINKEILIRELKDLKFNQNLISKSFKEEIESFKNTVIPIVEDFAYLAGFIDAECCFGIQRYMRKNGPNLVYKILLQCNNSKLPVFFWLVQRFGGHVHFIDRSHFKPICRNQMCWRLCSKALLPILNGVIPFLKNKKPVALELLKFYETTLKNGGARHTKIFRESYVKTLQLREEMFHRVKVLNKKGT